MEWPTMIVRCDQSPLIVFERSLYEKNDYLPIAPICSCGVSRVRFHSVLCEGESIRNSILGHYLYGVLSATYYVP
jgi:hypothetical protein